MEAKEQKKETISKTTFAMMLAVAIFFDVALSVIQLIPFAGSAAAMSFNTVPLMLFFIWYQLQGINFKNPKRAFTFFGTAVIEFIPIVNILPTWTAEIIYMYTLENKDKILSVVGGANKVASIAKFGAKVASFIPATSSVGHALGEVSHQASRIAQQAEMVHELKKGNSVGNEIRRPLQQKIPEPNNIVKFPAQKEETPANIVQFPTQEKNEDHNEDWVFRGDKAA